jgi:hypothetical protein
MGQTPIYDQVRGERINADVPAREAEPQRADYHGKHRLLPDTPVPAAVFGPPGPGDDLAPNHHCRMWTYPAGLPAADGQPAATGWGPHVTVPPEAHTRQAPRPAASSSPTPAAHRNPAAQDPATSDRGAHPEEEIRVRQEKRTEPHLTAPAEAQFPWFSASHDTCD